MNKEEFIQQNYADYTPQFETLKSIKLISTEDEEEGYRAVYLNMEETPILTLILKSKKEDKEKQVFSYPAYIHDGMIWLRHTQIMDNAYMILKEFEADLYLNPELVQIIAAVGFKYFPKNSYICGGEPSLTPDSLRKALGMPENMPITLENLVDYSVHKDYMSDKLPNRNKLVKKSKIAVFNLYSYYGFGRGKPGVNILHSALHPLEFSHMWNDIEVLFGNYFIKNGKQYFILKERAKASDVLIRYNGDPNIEHAMLISDGIDYKYKPYTFIVKPKECFFEEYANR